MAFDRKQYGMHSGIPLVTLTTIGYGDVVPISGEARILAALEGVTGVLYIATTVALLVRRFAKEPSD